MSKRVGEALGGFVDVLVNVIILDARGVPYKAHMCAVQQMPAKAVIEMGQQFNYPMMKNSEDAKPTFKLKAIITDIPNVDALVDGVTMVATIMDTKQVDLIKLDPRKAILAESITETNETFYDILCLFKNGNPEFKEVSKGFA